ncbi:MAG: hypothetical protein AAF214_10680 [Pseudomonadota bacterium]
MATRLVVHAGFHKTGTTTIQNTLAAHAGDLKAHLNLHLRPDVAGLCEAARAYSVSRSKLDLGLVAYEAAVLAEPWEHDTILLSSEDLSGHMPGRHGLTDYAAAAPIAKTMAQAWRAAHPDCVITFVYTTRAPEPWLASCYVQHLRATRIQLELAEYVETYASSARFSTVLDAVRGALPSAQVVEVPMESHAANLAAAVLDPCNLPASVLDRITAAPPANTAPNPDKIDQMLALNRSDMSDGDWRAARNKPHKQAR